MKTKLCDWQVFWLPDRTRQFAFPLLKQWLLELVRPRLQRRVRDGFTPSSLFSIVQLHDTPLAKVDQIKTEKPNKVNIYGLNGPAMLSYRQEFTQYS